jgi:predicted house-cleaning NTP pyrophosphatase (Maf/HAM1 superfamily)
LAQEKAFEVAKTRSGLIIASDQVATLGDEILTKPHSHENARVVAFYALKQTNAQGFRFKTTCTVIRLFFL